MINLIIYSADKPLFQGKVDSVYVPAKEGDFQVLSGHAPLLARLDKGDIRIHSDKEEKTFSIEAGFIEVHNNQITLLVK